MKQDVVTAQYARKRFEKSGLAHQRQRVLVTRDADADVHDLGGSVRFGVHGPWLGVRWLGRGSGFGDRVRGSVSGSGFGFGIWGLGFVHHCLSGDWRTLEIVAAPSRRPMSSMISPAARAPSVTTRR